MLGLPLAPRVAGADSASAALLARHESGPEAMLAVHGRQTLRDVQADPTQPLLVAMDAALKDQDGPLHRRRVEFRRDQPLSRRRWQFGLREEAVLGVAGGP